MKGIVLCRENIGGCENAAAGTPACLLRLCGRTLLERTLDRLIAAGISEAFIVREKPCSRTALAIKRYGSSDRILLRKAKELCSEKQSEFYVFDAVACADIDLASLLGEKAPEAGTALTDSKGNIVAARLAVNDIKSIGLTDEKDLFCAFEQALNCTEKKPSDLKTISTVSDIILYQAQILDKQGGLSSLTDSNFNGVTVIEPVCIGKNVTIQPGAVIGKGSVIDDDAWIGQGAQVIGSYVGTGAVIGRNSRMNGAYASDGSVLMNRSSLSGGAVLCSGVCLKPNSAVVGSKLVSPENKGFGEITFLRDKKQLTFDDDGICSLSCGTVDISALIRLGKAAASALSLGKTIAVGFSPEKNMSLLADALICGIRSAGNDVFALGECTLPQLGFAVGSTGSELGIFVGVDSNGDVRLVSESGLPVASRLEEDISLRFEQRLFRSVSASDLGRLFPAQSEKASYERCLASQLPKSFKGLNACVRTGDHIAAEMCDRLFHAANDVCGERVIFRLSADGTSMNAYCGSTGNVRWEQLCLLCCKIKFEQNAPVSLPYSLPLCAEQLASRFQGNISRYYTVNAGENDAKARETACLPNGSFVRDALLACVMICSYLLENRIGLGRALADIGELCFTQRCLNGCAEQVFAVENAQAVGAEGVKISDEHTSAFVRPSKDRRSLIIFAESTKTEFASAFCDELTEKLRRQRS